MNYRLWIFIAIFLFSVGLVLGIIAPAGLTNLLSEDIAALERFGAMLRPFEFSTLIVILLKNVSALLLGFIFSPILCLMPILSLLVNGWAIAYVSSEVVGQKSVGFVLAALIPHGIFEIPAFILGQAAALSFGTLVLLAIFKKEKRSLLLPSLKQNARYLLIALVLLVPAAIMETYVTPLLLV